MNDDKSSNDFISTGNPDDSIDAKKTADANTESTAEKEEALNIETLRTKYRILNNTIDNLFEHLKKSIIGQDECVKKLLFVAYNNQFLNMVEDISGIQIKRLNALAIGPSGVGKTMTISKISELFNVPYVKVDATSLTSAAYAGLDVDSIYLALIKAAGGDIRAAEHGIIFLDEIDKKVSTNPQNTAGRDVNGTAVQEELLKILQPSIIYLGKDYQPFDTHGVTVFLGGHFKDLEKIRQKRLDGESTIGFKSTPLKNEDDLATNSDKFSKEYIPEDLIKFGFIPEFVGRIHIYAEFEKLSLFDLIEVIHSDDSILSQYMQIFDIKGTHLYIDEMNFFNIACEVLDSPTGARDLEKKIIDLIYPALYQTLQSFNSGICEIDENKKYFGVFDKPSKD